MLKLFQNFSFWKSFLLQMKNVMCFIARQQVNNDLFSILEEADISDTVISVLTSDYSNGFIFDTTTIRLLSHKSGVEIDNEIQFTLKHQMFQRSDGVYFLPEVAASAGLRRKIVESANNFFENFGF